MSRIRTLKPEWLEDEKLAACSDEARVLSAGLILLADDQGRGRASPPYLASQVWTYHPREGLAKVSKALAELSQILFVILYSVCGEQFYQIRNWLKHQKVDHPAKPRLPGPEQADSRGSREGLAKVSETLAPHTPTSTSTTYQEEKKRTPSALFSDASGRDFDKWYGDYPHKVGKGAARKAYAAARKKASAGELLSGVERYKLTKPPDTPWCNPATWLNQERWLDQPSDPKGNGPARDDPWQGARKMVPCNNPDCPLPENMRAHWEGELCPARKGHAL